MSLDIVNLDAVKIRTLLDAVNVRQIISIQFDNSPAEANGILVGADLVNNELLICETFPDISDMLVHGHANQRIWIRMKAGTRFLSVCLAFMSIDNGLISAKLLNAQYTDNKRWYNRAAFSPLNGPEVRINREFATNFSGKLRDLSARGAAIDIWGKALNEDLSKGDSFTATIVFNRYFELQLNCRILTHQFIRKPSCHTQLRVRFNELDTLDFSQLNHFIEASASTIAA